MLGGRCGRISDRDEVVLFMQCRNIHEFTIGCGAIKSATGINYSNLKDRATWVQLMGLAEWIYSASAAPSLGALFASFVLINFPQKRATLVATVVELVSRAQKSNYPEGIFSHRNCISIGH